MDTKSILEIASERLLEMPGHVFNILSVEKPESLDMAMNLSRIVSKLSPLVGNLIEFNTVEFLNKDEAFNGKGEWKRQDPGFPDTIFESDIYPTPGFEVKAWFPLATEITGRFKDSQSHFLEDQTYVTLIAWLPENIIYGKPKVLDILVVSGMSVAKARDLHYHNPPDYLVLEPQDTKDRTRNLQQTNTSGYKIQLPSNPKLREETIRAAEAMVESWGGGAKVYSTSPEYQQMLKTLQNSFIYRLDTNFAKMGRIVHEEINAFERRVYNMEYKGKTIGEWNRLLNGKSEEDILTALRENLQIE
ncbi:TPA: hypothetical protein RQK93_003787 [Vibrio vulnificus]|uniref:hypothetical protein n=1 Tax=Vibrio metoecus TaxID=1481663 RepID=UPI00215CB5EC|nr:hypothetical protein [Vibrio metoecus]MCR9388745.1 hypothetical protein [Vibrio metoecus]HDY8071543.1 hypothetical protein [Vibrio vulnificus]